MTILEFVKASSTKITILAAGVVLCLMCAPAFAESTDLIAGQHYVVGSVDASSNGTYLVVTYDTNDDWDLVEVHLAVGCTLADIPQTRSGNPKIGHFPYSMSFNPQADSYSFTIPYAALPDACDATGDTVVIAAHAVVLDVVSLTTTEVLSGINLSDTMITRRRCGGSLPSLAGLPTPETCEDPTGKSWSGGDYDLAAPRQAVLAWEPSSGFPDPNPASSPSVWDALGTNAGTCETAGICFCEPQPGGECSPADFCTATTCADWIWDGYRVDDNNGPFYEPICGTVIRMEHNFNLPGTPQRGKLYLTCDNAYEVFLNGSLLGTAQCAGDALVPDWKLSPLCEGYPNGSCNMPYVFTDGWQNVKTYAVAAKLSVGANELIIDASNEHMESLGFPVVECKNMADGNININPAACIFRLSAVSATEEETAWCDGSPFPGRSWAEYFTSTLN